MAINFDELVGAHYAFINILVVFCVKSGGRFSRPAGWRWKFWDVLQITLCRGDGSSGAAGCYIAATY